jgi:DedD protein
VSDADNLDIKKRARRRLVGAIALALLAAVVLPMTMDQEPHSSTQDIQLTLPDREKVAPLVPPGGVAPAPVAALPTPEDNDASGAAATSESTKAPAPATPGASASADTPKQAAAPAPPETSRPAKPAEPPKPPKPPARTPEEEARVRAILAGEPVPARGESYVVQVGAFSDAGKAAKLADALKAKGFAAYTEPAGKVTRVRVGPIAGREAADKVVSRLKAAGHQAVVQVR